MAIKNFRIRPEGGNNFADTLHPETNIDQVLDKDGNPILHDYVRFPGYSTTTGINNYAIDLNPAPPAYKEGMRIAIKIGSANTEKATLNINNLGVKPIVDPEGEELEAGDLLANQVYNLIYTGTVFQLLGKGGDKIELTGNAFASQVLKDRTFYNTDPNNKLVGTMENNGNISKTLTNQNQSFTIPKGFHGGAGVIKASITNLIAGNIKKGINVGGVTGTYESTPSFRIDGDHCRMNDKLGPGRQHVIDTITTFNNTIFIIGGKVWTAYRYHLYVNGVLTSSLYEDHIDGGIYITKSGNTVTLRNDHTQKDAIYAYFMIKMY